MRRWTALPAGRATEAVLVGEVWAGITYGNSFSIRSFLRFRKGFWKLDDGATARTPDAVIPTRRGQAASGRSNPRVRNARHSTNSSHPQSTGRGLARR